MERGCARPGVFRIQVLEVLTDGFSLSAQDPTALVCGEGLNFPSPLAVRGRACWVSGCTSRVQPKLQNFPWEGGFKQFLMGLNRAARWECVQVFIQTNCKYCLRK